MYVFLDSLKIHLVLERGTCVGTETFHLVGNSFFNLIFYLLFHKDVDYSSPCEFTDSRKNALIRLYFKW